LTFGSPRLFFPYFFNMFHPARSVGLSLWKVDLCAASLYILFHFARGFPSPFFPVIFLQSRSRPCRRPCRSLRVCGARRPTPFFSFPSPFPPFELELSLKPGLFPPPHADSFRRGGDFFPCPRGPVVPRPTFGGAYQPFSFFFYFSSLGGWCGPFPFVEPIFWPAALNHSCAYRGLTLFFTFHLLFFLLLFFRIYSLPIVLPPPLFLPRIPPLCGSRLSPESFCCTFFCFFIFFFLFSYSYVFCCFS